MKNKAIGTLMAALACAGLFLGSFVGSAQGAPPDPLYAFVPTPPPPLPPPQITPPPVPGPVGYLAGPCGLAAQGNVFYLSDYYHQVIDAYKAELKVTKPWESYLSQLADTDPLDGPCGLALDASAQHLYVNYYHRSVVAYPVSGSTPSFGVGTEIAGANTDGSQPTGVAVDPATNYVYVDERTFIGVYKPNGELVEKIGEGSLKEGFGVAVTGAKVYVPDAGTNKVKVYEPAIDLNNPVSSISGPGSGFSSLRDTAIAVDASSGKLYVVDDLQPKLTERPEARVDVFSNSGSYLGRLKYLIVDALPPGLAVDNSATPSQGRVYVTSGNSTHAGLYVYAPGSETAFGLPATFSLASQASQAEDSSAAPSGSGPKAPASSSAIVQEDNVRLDVTGRLSPKRLPRRGLAPISVSVEWGISTSDGSPVPNLKRIEIEINRHGHFEYAGLPTCPIAKIQPASTARALSNCRSALVGKGSFAANVGLDGQEAYEAKGRLLVFNGEAKGKPVLFGQIYSSHPFATSFIIPFAVKKLSGGTYGTVLDAILPKGLAAWGRLTAIDMTLSRRYSYKGAQRSFVSAGCPAPKGFGKALFPLARTSFSFKGGAGLDSTLTSTCQVRG